MKTYMTLATASLMLLSANAQTYHSDALVNGVQTLKVQGNLLFEQYNNGVGGDLNVIGASHLSSGAEVLTNLPAGVAGYYYGPVKIGGISQICEYRFTKTGTSESGDMIVPLGAVGTGGAPIQIDVACNSSDPESGGAHFILMSKRFNDYGAITAVNHSAYGGGAGVEIYAKVNHGTMMIYVKFDALTYGGGQSFEHSLTIRMTSFSFGDVLPNDRRFSFEQTSPIAIGNSYVASQGPSQFPTGIVTTSQSIKAETIILDGKVTVTQPQGDISMGIYGH